MSNELPRLRFNRPLSGVRARRRPGPQPGGAGQAAGHLAERSRALRRQAEELARREALLEQKETELAARESAVEERLRELGALIRSVNEQKAQMLAENEEEIVALSLSITQKVLQYEIEHGKYKIDEVVRSTIQAVRDKGAVVVRVNPRDYELARAAVAELEQTFGTTRITTVPDESIPLASCCIETDYGKVFSEIPGRLERIERSLLNRNGEADGV